MCRWLYSVNLDTITKLLTLKHCVRSEQQSAVARQPTDQCGLSLAHIPRHFYRNLLKFGGPSFHVRFKLMDENWNLLYDIY